MAKQQKSLNIDDIVSRYKDLKKKGTGGADFLKLADGETRVRIIPFEDEETGELQVFKEFRQHSINKKFYTCPMTYGKPCPVCEAADKFWEAGEKDIAKDLNSKERFLFVVLHEGKLKVMETGAMVAKGITKYFADADYAHFTDLNEGHDVKIKRSGSGMDTEYDVIIVPKPTAVKLPSEPKDPISTIKSVLSDKELAAVVASHYDLDAIGSEGTNRVDEEPEETTEEMKARFKREAQERAKASAKKGGKR